MTLPWIRRVPGVPYFETDSGEPWTPIGQNDALTWPELRGVMQGDLAPVKRHLAWLRESGVTCLRLMLEYAQTDDCYFEAPDGAWNEQLVTAWDALVALCERAGVRLLLTPFDTFFTWNRWDSHPYNQANGGPCAKRTDLLTCPETRARIKRRLEFAARRWAGSGAVFAWDIWNEMHPVQGGDRPSCFEDFIGDVAPFLRGMERAAHEGRAHPQCASVFGPELEWKPWLREPIFRHPALDFASTHLYAEGSIDDPKDTVAPALAVGRLMADALGEIVDQRPLFDSEHGPIHTFKDKGITLAATFDDEYFRHTAWAHLASGGAGGGMRWPNRDPHVLTPGMRRMQRAMAGFLPLVDWRRFERRCLNDELHVEGEGIAAMGCGDANQAVLYLLRTAPLLEDGRVDARQGEAARVLVPEIGDGPFRAVFWDTSEGRVLGDAGGQGRAEGAIIEAPRFGADLAIAVHRADA